MKHLCEPYVPDSNFQVASLNMVLSYPDTTFNEDKYKQWFNSHVEVPETMRLCVDRQGATHVLVTFEKRYRTESASKFFYNDYPEIRTLRHPTWVKKYTQIMDEEEKFVTAVQNRERKDNGACNLSQWQQELVQDLNNPDSSKQLIRWYCMAPGDMEGIHIVQTYSTLAPLHYMCICSNEEISNWRTVLSKAKAWNRFCLFIVLGDHLDKEIYTYLREIRDSCTSTRIVVIASCAPNADRLEKWHKFMRIANGSVTTST